jgi:hypothetical protein
MQIVDGESDDANEKDDSGAPLPAVHNKWILQFHSQEYDLQQDMIEQDSHLR